MTGKSNLEDQFGPEPQEPQAPPQQPPPPPLSAPPRSIDSSAPDSPPAKAKLETSTRVLLDSHAGHTCALSRSANLVRTSNRSAQLSHRYSYMGISMQDSKLGELARMISAWPGLVAGPAAELVEDSLVLLEHLGTAERVVDVGSGGGLPGLPLKLARPEISMTLVEADHSKAAFLVQACATLGLRDVAVVARRAEEVGHDPLYREVFDVAVARALAPMPVLVELCLPLVRVGGRLLAQKTQTEDVEAARHAIEVLGGSLVVAAPAPSGARRRGTVVIVEKVRPTPPAYPRRPGVPSRKPL